VTADNYAELVARLQGLAPRVDDITGPSSVVEIAAAKALREAAAAIEALQAELAECRRADVHIDWFCFQVPRGCVGGSRRPRDRQGAVMSDYKALCERLRGYNAPPIDWDKAADAIESLQKQLEIALKAERPLMVRGEPWPREEVKP